MTWEGNKKGYPMAKGEGLKFLNKSLSLKTSLLTCEPFLLNEYFWFSLRLDG